MLKNSQAPSWPKPPKEAKRQAYVRKWVNTGKQKNINVSRLRNKSLRKSLDMMDIMSISEIRNFQGR